MADTQKQIFFVDDEIQICTAVGDILEGSDFEISFFDSASDCLKEMRSRRCDLLITDLKMPGMDGIDFLREAKKLAPWLPVLVITGYGDIPTAVRAIKAGAVDFIEKPINKDSLLRNINSILIKQSRYEYAEEALTRSEKRIIKMILEGKGSKEIAYILKRSKRTVDAHRANIMHKLGVSNLVDLFKCAASMGLVELPKDKKKSVSKKI